MKFINKLKLYTIYIVLGFLAWSSSASADLSISEIMYDGAGADIDWLEVYNGGTESVDLTSLKLLISNSPSNHEINSFEGSKDVPPGTYALIIVNSQLSGFLTKWAGLSPLFTSSFSLPNLQDDSSASVSLNNGDKNLPIDSVTYSKNIGGSDNGQSIQLIGNDWQESVPTPNRENYFAQVTEEDNSAVTNQNENQTQNTTSQSTSSNRSSSSSGSKKEPLPDLKITTKIMADKIVVAGLSFKIEPKTTTNRDTSIMTGRYVWNFGDGTTKDVDCADSFSHIYYYPGEYLVSLVYYKSKGSFEPGATDRLVIKVIEPFVIISSVGNLADPYIELENKGSYDLELSNFIISSMSRYFVIPDKTFILPNKKIKFSSLVTGFYYEDLSNLFIKNPRGEIIDRFPKPNLIINSTPIVQKVNSVRSAIDPARTENIIETTKVDETKQNSPKVIDLDNLNNQKNLSASAADSNFQFSATTYSLLGLMVVMILGISSYLFIKKSRGERDTIDKTIRAEDMTIIE